MAGDDRDGYLYGLESHLTQRLARVNRAGLAALGAYLANGEAVAFLGAGVSAPLYPLWSAMVIELIDCAEGRGLPSEVAGTCRQLAASRPDTVVDLVSRHLGLATFHAVLREVFRVRRDPDTGQTWTQTHELVCRCAFKAVVTTNHDPGIVDARMHTRPHAVGTGFTSWNHDMAMDRWRTGDVFLDDDDLPVLFAHGHHNQPDAMVLAAGDCRRAYGGKLAEVMTRMVDSWHLVWLGFSFADQRIAAVLREVAESSGTRTQPGAPTRHVALMAFDPAKDMDPATLVELTRIEYGADPVLYPVFGDDHGALHRLLVGFTDPKYPPAPARSRSSAMTVVEASGSQATLLSGASTAGAATLVAGLGEPVRQWVHGPELARVFVGRMEELSRLDRWAADPSVRLVGVSAWGGAGKTTLVAQWIEHEKGGLRRPGVRGVFGWSFYADPNADGWGNDAPSLGGQYTGLLGWPRRRLST